MIQEKTVTELLDDLQKVVDTLKANLPKQAPLLFSKSTDPLRALHLREACYHRITELAESACGAFKKGNNVSGYILARAVMETFAFFYYFVSKVSEAIACEDAEELREALSKIVMSLKAQIVKDGMEEGLGVAFQDSYDFLCEVTHPNVGNLIKAYVKNDWSEKLAYFGKEEGSLGSHLASDIEALVVLLEEFLKLNAAAALLSTEVGKKCAD